MACLAAHFGFSGNTEICVDAEVQGAFVIHFGATVIQEER